MALIVVATPGSRREGPCGLSRNQALNKGFDRHLPVADAPGTKLIPVFMAIPRA
jgi:hypothetical protein